MESFNCGERVVVVDDDPSVRMSLEMLLEEAGFLVDAYASAEEALAGFAIASAECLVADVHLGGMTGIELRDKLYDRQQNVPTIFITGRDDSVTRAALQRAGIMSYLRKPLDPSDFLRTVRRALGSRGKRQS
jgi:FixJ family two-component response regulator